MLGKTKFLLEPILDLFYSVLVVLESLLEVVGHLLAEGRVGSDRVGEDDCRSLGGGISTAVLELLPVLERRDVEVQLGLIFEERQIRRFYLRHGVGGEGVLGSGTGTRGGLALLAAGAGELLAVLAALARSRLAGLALITWKLLTASATSTLLRLAAANSTLADTTGQGFVTVLTAFTGKFFTFPAWTLAFPLGFLTPWAALTV